MVNYLEDATKENPSVMVKKTFQSMALDVIAKVNLTHSYFQEIEHAIISFSSVLLVWNLIHMKTLTMKCSSMARRCSMSLSSPTCQTVSR